MLWGLGLGEQVAAHTADGRVAAAKVQDLVPDSPLFWQEDGEEEEKTNEVAEGGEGGAAFATAPVKKAKAGGCACC